MAVALCWTTGSRCMRDVVLCPTRQCLAPSAIAEFNPPVSHEIRTHLISYQGNYSTLTGIIYLKKTWKNWGRWLYCQITSVWAALILQHRYIPFRSNPMHYLLVLREQLYLLVRENACFLSFATHTNKHAWTIRAHMHIGHATMLQTHAMYAFFRKGTRYPSTKHTCSNAIWEISGHSPPHADKDTL